MSRRLLVAVCVAAAAVAAACGDDETVETPPPTDSGEWSACQASSEALAARIILAVWGRHPRGRSEVNALASIYERLEPALGADGAKRALVDAMSRDPEYAVWWGEAIMDSLKVRRDVVILSSTYSRIEADSCYGSPVIAGDGGELARYVRDNSPSATTPPTPQFTLGQLLGSSIALDDLSPLLRANLFHLLLYPMAGANVDPLELERARRMDFGVTFEKLYLHRDPTCLPCHNSEFSVTQSDDPVTNRSWPVPGLFEKALYGDSAALGAEVIQFRSMLRVDGVRTNDGSPPWGWSAPTCGEFRAPVEADPLGIDTRFGTVGSTSDDPGRGLRASVFGLEASLRRGVESLRGAGLTVAPDGSLEPDQAFAYMTGQAVANRVWEDIIGTPLTIANFIPRTEAQRDTLQRLTDAFVEGGFSLRALLSEIVVHPAFNLRDPDDWCGDDPYVVPRIFDPYSDADPDPARRGNSSADRVQHRGPRRLLWGLHKAMGWPPPPDFPEDEALDDHVAFGLYLSPEQPGFRGLDLQARLRWEAAYGDCASRAEVDLVDRIVAAGLEQGASLEEGIIVLKDRLVGDSQITSDAERGAFEAMLGLPLSTPISGDTEVALRRVCGALVTSPQFLLEGHDPVSGDGVPALALDGEDEGAAACARFSDLLAAAGHSVPYGCAIDEP